MTKDSWNGTNYSTAVGKGESVDCIAHYSHARLDGLPWEEFHHTGSDETVEAHENMLMEIVESKLKVAEKPKETRNKKVPDTDTEKPGTDAVTGDATGGRDHSIGTVTKKLAGNTAHSAINGTTLKEHKPEGDRIRRQH